MKQRNEAVDFPTPRSETKASWTVILPKTLAERGGEAKASWTVVLSKTLAERGGQKQNRKGQELTPSAVEPEYRGEGSGMQELARKAASLV